MDTARYTFVLDIPPHFQRDVRAGAAAGDPAQRRRDRGDAGRDRRRLHAADRGTRDRATFVERRIAAPPPVDARGPGRLQPERHAPPGSRRHGHHQQRHDAGDHPGRRRGDPRARARHDGPPAGHAADARSRSPWRRSGRTALSSRSPSALSLVVRGARPAAGSRSPARSRCSWPAPRSTCSSPRRSASSSARSRARCRSSGCCSSWWSLPMNLLSGGNTPLESMPAWLQT